MPRGPLVVLLVSSGLAALALLVLGTAPADPAERHWAAPPLLAFSILFSMGGLVAAVTARRSSLK